MLKSFWRLELGLESANDNVKDQDNDQDKDND